MGKLPDNDRVVRHAGWTKLRKDEDLNVLGLLYTAFALRPGEEYLSVNWIEFFHGPGTDVDQTVWAIRQCRNVAPKSAFGVGNVNEIKACCKSRNARVRIVHEPLDGEPSHAAIRQLPADDIELLQMLANDVFAEVILNSAIPPRPFSLP